MAAVSAAIPGVFRPPKPLSSWRSHYAHGSVPSDLLASRVRFSRMPMRHYRMVQTAASAAGSAGSSHWDNDENPYEVLGVMPIDGFDKMKSAYTRRRKDAEKIGDEAAVARLERAYDKIMMSQLTKRKKGQTFGSVQVSKDIKYADKQPIVPWGPRFNKSNENDMRINMAISAVFTIWILVKRSAEWKPLQFLAFVFVYRIFEKLKSFEPAHTPTYNEESGEDEGRALRMGKRLLRFLSLVFSCIAVTSVGFTGILNLIEYLGHYIPLALYNSQELLVTVSTAIVLYIMASYYR